jgi:FkbM family methyltransferase
MTLMKVFKRAMIWPLSRSVPTVQVGSIDSWRIVDKHLDRPFVIAAGVGKNITFEIEVARRWDADVVLLDPTPTGVYTMSRLDVSGSKLRYLAVGLAAKDGVQRFSPPINAEEGSFSIARTDAEIIEFECRSLQSLLRDSGRNRVDILKMDIEGFEYGVLDRMLRDRLRVDQLCIELHINLTVGAKASVFDAFALLTRLYFAGYRIVYNKAMDFTLIHRSAL